MPRVKRARGYRLYDYSGRRYLDLCLDGGRALLGHRSGRSVLMMKNAFDKGLSASYPGVWEARLLKQLRMLYPEITACSVIFAGGDNKLPVFRPLECASPAESPECRGRVFELLLPLPGAAAYSLVCSTLPDPAAAAGQLPPASPVPQFVFSGLCRAAADLRAFTDGLDSDLWKGFDSNLWERRGPWLYPSVSGSAYPELFSAFLENGILLSPDPDLPSCAPSEFTEGEIKPIKRIEAQFQGS